MQRLLSSCTRSRSFLHAPPRSFLIPARFSSPSVVLSPELNNMVVKKAIDASAKTLSSCDDRWSDKSKKIMAELSRSPPGDAYSGRFVNNPRDLSTTFRILDGILSRNRVRYQLNRTRRHEKKGTKRRRLRSERWRKQFANEVRNKVNLVIKIRKRGA